MNGDQGLIYKSVFFEPVIRVPLILRVPPKWGWPHGIASDALVELIDLAATLTDLAGSPLPPSFEGRSFRAILEGRESEGREIALSEYEGSFCLIQPRWKAELTPDHVLVSVFDLEIDPGEQTNARDTAPRQDWKEILEQLLARSPAYGPPASIDRFAKRQIEERRKKKKRGLLSSFVSVTEPQGEAFAGHKRMTSIVALLA